MDKINAWLAATRQQFTPNGRPLVTLSYAQSLDGSLAPQRGQSFDLSGLESRKMTHRLRAHHDAILIGIGTVLADNPHLTVKYAAGKDPRPVILDTHLRVPLGCRLLERKENLPWIAYGENPDEEKIAELTECKVRLMFCDLDRHNRIDLVDLLGQLHESGIHSLMVEGGASVITSFLEARLVDLVVLTIVPVWLGGLHTPEIVLSEHQRMYMSDQHYTKFGKDLVVYGRAQWGEG